MRHFQRLRIPAVAALLVCSLSGGAIAKTAAAPHPPRKAAPQASPSPDVAPLFADFAARRGGPLAATWSARTGRLESLYGTLAEGTARSEAGARAFLAENAALFGMRAA